MSCIILIILDPVFVAQHSRGMTSPPSLMLFTGKPEKPAREAGRGPGRPTREQSDRRNRELLDTALDLFLEHGFDGTTIEAIVDKVGMARRTVYTRYGDKITLFKAALQRAIDDWVVAPERLRSAEREDLEATLLAVARLMVANVRTESGMRLARIANAEAFRMPEIAAYLWERTAQVALDYLADLFARRISPDTAHDTAHAFLLLVVEGAFQTIVWGKPTDAEFDRQIVFRTRLFLRGACAL
jgi:TetR/AcrR family transcriptional regulator, mexJK operon transcriptional repressor